MVSSAAGGVGSLVGQIGKLYGCRVVGITGSDEKCRWIVENLGFDAAINHRSEPVFKRLKDHCPRGIDIYFDNVGGNTLEDVLNLINDRARLIICGMLALYNDVGGSLTLPAGPNNLRSSSTFATSTDRSSCARRKPGPCPRQSGRSCPCGQRPHR